VDNELEVIRDEMEQTRANLADKLGALETQVRETVSGATEAVNSTVEGVKEVVETVSETVESVTETFNVSRQFEQHPWLALGAAVATGFVVAQIIGRVSQAAPAPVPPPAPELPLQPVAQTQPAAPREQPAQQKEESGLLHSLESMLPDVKGVMGTLVGSLGGLAVSSLMGVIREMASSGLPQEWKGEVTQLVDQVTTKLGGKPLDSTRSSQLVHALGLGGHGEQDQGGQQREGQRQEGAPSDAARHQGGQSVGNGPRDLRGAGKQPTTPQC
jgi:ElaB/YqjD/DUF883 family membrane-anchored ribosome-binding protein